MSPNYSRTASPATSTAPAETPTTAAPPVPPELVAEAEAPVAPTFDAEPESAASALSVSFADADPVAVVLPCPVLLEVCDIAAVRQVSFPDRSWLGYRG